MKQIKLEQLSALEWQEKIDKLKCGDDAPFMEIMFAYYHPLVVELRRKGASEDEAYDIFFKYIVAFRDKLKNKTSEECDFSYTNLPMLYTYLKKGILFRWLTFYRDKKEEAEMVARQKKSITKKKVDSMKEEKETKNKIELVFNDTIVNNTQANIGYNIEIESNPILEMLSKAIKQLPESRQRIIEWRCFRTPPMEWDDIEKALGKNHDALKGIMPKIYQSLGSKIKQMYQEKGEDFDLTF